MKLWNIQDNNDDDKDNKNDDDDGQQTHFDQKSSLEPSAVSLKVQIKVIRPHIKPSHLIKLSCDTSYNNHENIQAAVWFSIPQGHNLGKYFCYELVWNVFFSFVKSVGAWIVSFFLCLNHSFKAADWNYTE